ncbi:uncharacterized protein [Fopius arisanus]|uniref:Uncharacterized protein isoform X1 n=2 Tax=Fopius arisanus TaxID=64838 RepID=A0A9R1TA07_9HYME|nr:PREDICTED: uncharacterized protein LOC105268004 isoform X1 [Fopius arisanus]
MKIHIYWIVALVVADRIRGENPNKKIEFPSKISSGTGATESLNDAAVRRVLSAITNRKFPDDDGNLLELMKNGVIDAARLIKGNPKASFQAAHKKAQDLVSNITASYTQAIFKSKSPAEAKQTLHRFQKLIKKIVDFTKSGVFLP